MLFDEMLAGDKRLESKFLALAELYVELQERISSRRTVEPTELSLDLKQLIERRSSEKYLFGLTGFPASGKTSLARELILGLNAHYGSNVAAYVPMDGFHFTNEKLKKLGLDREKGSLRTYDVSRLVKTLKLWRETFNRSTFFPTYNRSCHEVEEDAIEIAGGVKLVVVEGIYIGAPFPHWEQLVDELHELVFLDVSPATCAQCIVARNKAVGRDEPTISLKLSNDFDFMKTIISFAHNVDTVVRPTL